jgi:hypothetical protein
LQQGHQGPGRWPIVWAFDEDIQAPVAVKEPLIKKPSTKTSSRWIKKWERAEGRKGLRQQSGG